MSLKSFGRQAVSSAAAAAALCVALTGFSGSAHAEEPVHVVLFGGSSVRTSYLPDEEQHHSVLQAHLREAYPQQEIEVSNWADNGESIPRYLLRGTYERHRSQAKGMDVAIIRFGTNDQKVLSAAEYEAQLAKLIELLQKDFPGVQIVLETGIYVDYPAHYSFDRNKTLNPYWQASRNLSAGQGFPLVEYYEASREQTEAGNWDQRIRNIRKKGKKGNARFVYDASEDAGKENDPKWFTDIHPNLNGVTIAVREEVETLRKAFPERLPSGQTAAARQPHSSDFYAEYLNFDPQKLDSRWPSRPNPERDLQSASQAPAPKAGKTKK